MTNNQIVGIVIYALVILQCGITTSIIFIRARKTPTLYTLCVAQLLVVLWLIFGMVENMARTTAELHLAIRFTLFPISVIGGFWLLFALFYTERITIKNKLLIALIFTPLVLSYLPALTNSLFFLTLRSKEIADPTITVWGIFETFNVALTYIYIAASIVILIHKSLKDYHKLKGKVILIILAGLIISSVNVLNVLLIRLKGFDLTPVSASISLLLITIAVFKYKFFDVIPQATMEIFKNLDEAIILLDSDDNIIEYNNAAKTEFLSISQMCKGEKISNFFNALKTKSTDHKHMDEIIRKIINKSVRAFDTQIELIFHQEELVKKRYRVYFKTILSDRGQELGRIFSFKDNTEMFLLLLEKERKRISGDIHDNLSNMINVVSMNLEYGLKHLEGKAAANIINSFETAYETAKGIRINLRRVLEELEPLDIEKNGLFRALESLFNKVNGTGLFVEFYHHGIDEKKIRSKEHGYVIYKTCMEALNNSLFSGKAKKISFVLSQIENNINLLISDDGIGCENLNKGRGLMAMENRIYAIGGKVAFESAQDEGFNISIQIPCLV